MAKKYQNLSSLWSFHFCELHHDFMRMAIFEIAEMLYAMGVKKGEEYVIKSKLLCNSSSTISVIITGDDDDLHLGENYMTNDPEPFDRNFFEYTSQDLYADNVTSIHERIRQDYNKFVKTHKASK